ncbi:unnamed protein product [Rhizoctonia solani]|uniref:5'-Nucleotidase C-terminal domain-containing protein n=1 Tax=Rhizoctonia solani TaxID=456999 RepID=A0A8H2XIF9_9AGAM|nr:unnamed protein product [Rhizoctonia solani]
MARVLSHEVIKNMQKPVAQLPTNVPRSVLANPDQASRRKETVLGNWIADSMIRWYTNLRTPDMNNLPDLIFIMTGGSIRSGPEPNQTEIKQGDIIKLLPFGTPLCTLKMSGKDLWAVLECALDGWVKSSSDPPKNKKAGCFPVVSGLEVKWNSNESEKRIVSVRLLPSGTAVAQDDKVQYNVLTHTYISDGGDGLDPFKPYSEANKVYKTEVPIYQALLEVIRDISVKEAQKILQPAPARDTSTSDSSKDVLSTLPLGLFGPLFPFGLIQMVVEMAIEDRPLLMSETIFNQAVTIANATNLPELNIPLKVDGRMKDLSGNAV